MLVQSQEEKKFKLYSVPFLWKYQERHNNFFFYFLGKKGFRDKHIPQTEYGLS